jgi:flavin-binding protein dodecin
VSVAQKHIANESEWGKAVPTIAPFKRPDGTAPYHEAYVVAKLFPQRIDDAPSIRSREGPMAKKRADGVYKIVDVVGVSDKSWEDAGRMAVETAAGSLRDLRVAEVTRMDMKVENGKVAAFRTRVSLSFKYES